MANYKIEDWQAQYRAATTETEREQAIKNYQAAKLYNAAIREENRFNQPGLIDIILRMTVRQRQ